MPGITGGQTLRQPKLAAGLSGIWQAGVALQIDPIRSNYCLARTDAQALLAFQRALQGLGDKQQALFTRMAGNLAEQPGAYAPGGAVVQFQQHG